MKNEFLVDIVYLWCDGNDPQFLKRKNEYQKINIENKNNFSTGDIRFFDNDELKYSLRSLEKNAPWINHIFIVTDRQVPKWLNLANPKITIVDHAQILPASIIPCFNSSVIERYIGFIPHLHEHFLYANDDTFFGEPIEKNFFFLDGKPIVRLVNFNQDTRAYKANELIQLKTKSSFWGKSVINSWELLFSKYNLYKTQLYENHHNIDAFTKKSYCECYFRYKDKLDSSQNRFRNISDYQRVLFSMDAVYQNYSIPKLLHKYSKIRKYFFWLKKLDLDSYYIQDKFKSLLALRFIHPRLFCINNSDRINLRDKKYERDFLENRFPDKSSFEI
ncbi:MAG: stealth family protein [Selenomonadales bacterium]|nr:stealth family protein [Selenomonadales bacterium]